MAPHLSGLGGNPSSMHVLGRAARAAVDEARAHVAALIGATPEEIVFTSGGTEADSLAVLGTPGLRGPGGRVVTSAIEHPAVLEACKVLAGTGTRVDLVGVDADGVVDVDALTRLLDEGPAMGLVSVMTANNVVGTVQPVAAVAAVCRERGVRVHTDAVQAGGHLPLNVDDLGVDLLSLSAHKLHGPQGIGALYVRGGAEQTPLDAVLPGGGQEGGLRSGTENVAAIVGFGEAARLALVEGAVTRRRLVELRDRIIDRITGDDGRGGLVPGGAYLLGHRWMRLPGHVCLGLSGLEGEAIKVLLALDEAGFCVSSGSACSVGHSGPSHVLQAMGLDPIRARGSLRVTLGRFTTAAQVDAFLDALPRVVAQLRPLTSAALR
jgi:cysteine desulfurase